MVAVMAGRRTWWPVLVAALLLWLTVPGLPAPAEAAPGQTGAKQADVVLLLDRSGSMIGNDPGGLAVTGARVFLDMLDPADRVAVVAFDTGARTLVPLAPVGGGDTARRALDGLGRPEGQWTDIKAALQTALDALGPATAERQPAVLLFTDGKPETQPGGVPSGYNAELTALATQLAGRAVPVFSIGLGQADVALLNQVAAYTRAEAFVANSSDQVVRLFADVLSRIKERQVVLSFAEDLAPGVAGQPRTFTVPPYTRLLTLSGVGGPGGVSLKGQLPGGAPLESAPGLKASQGGNYTVYTIPNPPPGTYTVRLEGEGKVEAHAQTESALKFRLVEPEPYSQVGRGENGVEVAVVGDPDPASPLEVWAQSGAGRPVRLDRSGGDRFRGGVDFQSEQLTVWAARAGAEVARREFRLYLGSGGPQPQRPLQEAGVAGPPGRPWWQKLLLSLAAVTAGAAALLGLGALNWRRLQRREGVLSGRLGTHSLEGRGREVRIGDLARLEARLAALTWPPLAGLHLGRRELQVYIHQAAGVRIEINGRPPGDGRLYHGDEVTLGGETLRFHNHRVARRPVAPRPRPVARTSRPTLKG